MMRTDRSVGTKARYYGETSRNSCVRGQQHISALQRPEQDKNNAFVKHRNSFHNGEELGLQMFKRQLELQVWEGVELHLLIQFVPVLCTSNNP